MISSLKKWFKLSSAKSVENTKTEKSLLLAAFIGFLEDILFWKKMWLSLSCLIILNIIFFIFIHKQINFLQCIFALCATITSIDAFEAWLIYKHRTSCLKRLSCRDSSELSYASLEIKKWLRTKRTEFVYLRKTNHTKAFLLVNIILSTIFLVGKYISGYTLLYLLCMSGCVSHKLVPPVTKLMKKIQQNAESDGELEGLIPEVSDLDRELLSMEPDRVIDDRQSLDYWKPDDSPPGDTSDSSENSSSLVTNLTMEKMHTLEKDIETSDSSEDEYIPLMQQIEQLQSTMEVVPPGGAGAWSSTAYSAFFNLTGAVASMMYSSPDEKRKRVSSVDSSDGFEMIDKSDLI